ncbi:MAG: hydroxymethylglutaryl-CoA lyase [Bacteroidetes bacterium]|nr:hydroxymethylglutaryl-CoA lyase [Bacteroidota bacterium]MBL6944458.1 hydroxymethylglutaryl-CoA lyase [Bacteroidales bacterium]
MVNIIETPRDGFQGLPHKIPTNKKIEYINLLLQCGFHTVEVGSFVSPKAIPQMADTAEVLDSINFENSKSKIAVLAATKRGGEKAMALQQVDQVFFPFSISPTFLKKNINQTLEQAEKTVDDLQNLCVAYGKELIVYFSMGFGPAYGDEWSMDLLFYWVKRMMAKELLTFPFSDILGEASPDRISKVFTSLKLEFPDVEFGFHLHSLDYQRMEKVDAAYKAGIRRFDTVINGLGGCPQTGKELVGNLPLESFLDYCAQNHIPTNLNSDSIQEAIDFNLYT